MGIHVVIQPLAGYGAEVASPSPGVRQLLAGGEGATLVIQVPARIGGLLDAARFARSLAAAASEFGEWCEAQNRTRSHPSPLTAQWQDALPEPPRPSGARDDNSGHHHES